MASQQPYIQLQTLWVSSPEGKLLAQAIRVIMRDTYENRVAVKFEKGLTDKERQPVQDVLSRNIHMFGKGAGGGVRWLYFKKGTMEQWVFAAVELEKRGYKVKRDASTLEHTRDFISMYVDNARSA